MILVARRSTASSRSNQNPKSWCLHAARRPPLAKGLLSAVTLISVGLSHFCASEREEYFISPN